MKRLSWIVMALLVLPFMEARAQLEATLENAFPNLTFSRPVDLQHAGDGTDRLFVLEQHRGRIIVFPNDPAAETSSVFLQIDTAQLSTANEEGLLGLAFHPDYATNGYLYVYYSIRSPRRSRISRFQVDPNNADLADPATETVILDIPQPFSNHNGGQLAFGPTDGYLYIGLGDGGDGGDPEENGEDPTTLLGSILRIDIDNPANDLAYGIPSDNPFVNATNGERAEIFAYGLRNPWRFSIDPETGWLWTGDVGQGRLEEIDVIENGGDYGWDILEGNQCYEPRNDCVVGDRIPPVWVYGRGDGVSVTGGYVYRGVNHPRLFGKYIYADYASGRIWALEYDGSAPAQNEELTRAGFDIPAFGVSEANELFILGFDGRIYQFQEVINVGTETPDLGDTVYEIQSFPNPFQSETRFSFSLNQPDELLLEVYNILGQRVRSLTAGSLPAGMHRFTWYGENDNEEQLPSGIYLYKITLSSGESITNSIVLMR